MAAEDWTSDVVIVGAGHNALVAAFYLARAGLAVRCVEAKSVVGGACKTEELIPGYRFSTCANLLAYLRPKVAADLRLVERGLRLAGMSNHATLVGDGATGSEVGSGRGAAASAVGFHPHEAWDALWKQAAALLGPYLLSYPPTHDELRERADRIGGAEVLETILSSTLGELADRTDGLSVVENTIVPPFDVGTIDDPGSALLNAQSAAAMTYSETGDPGLVGYPAGGMGAITQLMAEAAREAGAVIETDAPVRRILVEDGAVRGVELEDGRRLSSTIVLAGTDIRRTFGRLLDGVAEVAEVATKVRGLSARAAPLKLHVALSGLPDFGRGATDSVILNSSRAHFAGAWEDAMNGRMPRNPYMHLMIPSVGHPDLAPEGHHTMSVWSLYAPSELAESTWAERRDEMADRMLEIIGAHSPDFASLVVDRFLLTPADIEERVLLTGGQIHHVDIIPEQLLANRPLPELARYRAPVSGLYLCGAGQHPYGEVTGAPGHNAAHAVLEDLGRIDDSWQEVVRVDGR